MNKGTQAVLYTRWVAVSDALLTKGYSLRARACMDMVRALLDLDPDAYGDSHSRECVQQITGFLGSLAGAHVASDPACWYIVPLINAVQAALLGDPADTRAALATLDRFLAPHLAETWG